MNVHAVLLRLNHAQLTIRASVLRYSEELCFVHETFKSVSRRLLKMKVRERRGRGWVREKGAGLEHRGRG